MPVLTRQRTKSRTTWNPRKTGQARDLFFFFRERKNAEEKKKRYTALKWEREQNTRERISRSQLVAWTAGTPSGHRRQVGSIFSVQRFDAPNTNMGTMVHRLRPATTYLIIDIWHTQIQGHVGRRNSARRQTGSTHAFQSYSLDNSCANNGSCVTCQWNKTKVKEKRNSWHREVSRPNEIALIRTDHCTFNFLYLRTDDE